MAETATHDNSGDQEVELQLARTLNNRAWDLLELPHRSAGEAIEMLHTAHAAACLWSRIGTTANRVRAECLVSNVHAATGDGSAAVRHADLCQALAAAHPDELQDWDFAFVADCLARSRDAAGQSNAADAFRTQAREMGDQIRNPDDRAAFDAWFQSRSL